MKRVRHKARWLGLLASGCVSVALFIALRKPSLLDKLLRRRGIKVLEEASDRAGHEQQGFRARTCLF